MAAKPDQMRASRDDTLARKGPFKHLDVSALADSELHGPAKKRFAGLLNEDHRPASVVHKGRLGHGRSGTRRFGEQSDVERLMNRDAPVPVIHLVDDWKGPRLRVHHSPDGYEAAQRPRLGGAGNLQFRPAEIPHLRQFRLGHNRGNVDRIGVDDLEDCLASLYIGAGRGRCLHHDSGNRSAQGEQSGTLRIRFGCAGCLVLGNARLRCPEPCLHRCFHGPRFIKPLGGSRSGLDEPLGALAVLAGQLKRERCFVLCQFQGGKVTRRACWRE